MRALLRGTLSTSEKLNPSDFVARVKSEYGNGKATGPWVGLRFKEMSCSVASVDLS